MKSWRGRIGLLVPSINCTMEPTFNEYLPDGIAVHTARMKRHTNVSDVDTNIRMLDNAVEAAKLVAQSEPDFILLGCTTATFVQGKGKDLEIGVMLEEATGIKSSTTSTAVCNALRALGIKRFSFLAPHIGEILERAKIFFYGNGFEILTAKGMNISNSMSIPAVKPEEIYRFAKQNYHPDSEAIFLNSTNFRAMDIVKPLEQDLGIPVVTSNQASLWYVLRRMGFDQDIGVGELFKLKLPS